jgi:pilus assembly protein CpaF
VDATLADGSRLHVVIPDITRRHWAVNIRRIHARIVPTSLYPGGGPEWTWASTAG